MKIQSTLEYLFKKQVKGLYIRICILALFFSCWSINGYCQLVLNSPNTTGSFSAPTSITLGVGFSASGANGIFVAKIDPGYNSPGGAASINFISTWTPLMPISTTPQLKGEEDNNTTVNISTKFTDGLGRTIQIVAKKQTVNNVDLIQPFEYDLLSRQAKKYLPYAYNSSTPGSYRPNATITEQTSFYNSGNTLVPQSAYPFSKTAFDNSPLDRSIEEGAPGDSWQLTNSGVANSGHTVKLDYSDNNNVAITDVSNTRAVVSYSVSIDNNGVRSLIVDNNSYYSNSDLFVKTLYGDNWTSADGKAGTQEVYTNKEGKIILKRSFVYNKSTSSIDILSTYFVYDDFQNLCYVLPPGATPDVLNSSGGNNVSSATLNSFCYQYLYDEKQRNIAKRIPGKDWEYIVYNNLNKVVAIQDGNQRLRNEWFIKKLDGLGRIIITGIWNNNNVAITRDALQAILNQQTVLNESRISTGNGYSNLSWPQNFTAYAVSYFDDYNIPNLPAGYSYQTYAGNANGYSNQTAGLLTITETWPLSNLTTPLWTFNYYDSNNRIIQVQSTNQLGGKDIYNNEYSFIGQVTKNVRQHSSSVTSLTVSNRYNYDHHGRIIQHYEQIGADPEVLLSQLTYNDLGQVINKKLHQKSGSSKFIQSIDYRYNIRGWLTSINDPSLTANNNTNPDNSSTSDVDKYGVSYKYEQALLAQYNGNIGSMQWAIAAPAGSSISSPLLKYDFRYDKLNRLTESVSSTGSVKDANFSEYLSYDKMGNIQTLGRWAKLNSGKAGIDSLQYTYTGNQVTEVDDISGNNTYGFGESVSGANVRQANEYIYDLNGNLTKDLNKGISSITYNNFNLPLAVTWSNGSTLIYDYDGYGNKLKKVYTTQGNTYITNYVSGIQYEQGQIAFVTTDEGISRKNSGGTNYVYQYALKDKLGNTRVIIQPISPSETTADVIQINNYYPFGLEYGSNDPNLLISFVGGDKNNYLYNGKELQIGINEYDYGARMYDPAIGRWSVIDAMADEPEQINKSPYQYAWNNPVLNTDPDGNCPLCIAAAIGAVIGGTANLISHWHKGITFTEGLEAFGVGALAGAVTGLTGGAAFGATAGGLAGLAAIENAAAIGAFSAASGSVIQGAGNQAFFGDSYTFGEFANTAILGGITAGLAQGITQMIQGNPFPALSENAGRGDIPLQADAPSMKIPDATFSGGQVQPFEIGENQAAKGIDMANARWSQKSLSSTFSKWEETPELFRGKPIDHIADGLRNGTILPEQVPVKVVIRDGNTLIVNTRSSVSLLKANIPISRWTVINATGEAAAEKSITSHLQISNLTSAGINTVSERGTLNIFIWPH